MTHVFKDLFCFVFNFCGGIEAKFLFTFKWDGLGFFFQDIFHVMDIFTLKNKVFFFEFIFERDFVYTVFVSDSFVC